MAFLQLPRVLERFLMAWHAALLRRSLRTTGLPKTQTDAYAEAMLKPGAMTAAINPYRALRARGVLAVGRITVPTLYVWGTDDAALGPVAARATAKEVDGPYRFVVLDGVSHWIPETGVEELSSLVVSHMRGAAPACP